MTSASTNLDGLRAGATSCAPAAPPPLPPAPPPLPQDTAAASGVVEEVAASSLWSLLPSWLASTVLHAALLLGLALYSVMDPPHFELGQASVVARPGDGEGEKELEELNDLHDSAATAAPAANLDEVLSSEPPAFANQSLDMSAGMPSAPKIENPLMGLGEAVGQRGGVGPEGDLLGGIGDSIKDSLQGRLSSGNRARMVASGGGTAASEAAVTEALKWLAEHQSADGSWSYDHHRAPHCHGSCSHPGHLANAKIAATAMALLPFLGTGQTHHEGKYKKNVEKGIYFLIRSMRREEQKGGSLWDPLGTMYGHGLASIVLCEAYGMTRDNLLEEPAQAAINYIGFAQDPLGGGWRYLPQTPGDTSVVGWQLMALKSANMAYLKVPPDTVRKAGYFLDSVQVEDGAAYGYQGPGRRYTTTAIGLLCRMYMGWPREQPPLVRGVAAISEAGPSLENSKFERNNMYYNYYATQVLHHYGGYEWTRWNAAMRDYLISTQAKKGHEQGSWYFDGTDQGSQAGGRLYCTAMATMILEVYYRHLPLYSDRSTKDRFGE